MHISFFGLVASMASLFGVAAVTSKPDVIDLPTGFFPGGITLGEGWTVYVGSNSGDNLHIYIRYIIHPRLTRVTFHV